MDEGKTETALSLRLTETAKKCGATNAAVIAVSGVETDASFRKLCEANSCGNYGRNYMCPPACGEIGPLMAELKSYRYALVFQTIGQLEDSYDFEGMTEAGSRHSETAQAIHDALGGDPALGRTMQLNAGGCKLCPVCGKRTNEPCRHPDRAFPSLEAYGVNVSLLAPLAGMKYINGQNTVTYFGALFFDGTEASADV